MKCVRCRARNADEAVTCWACGVRLRRPGRRQVAAAFRPDALRYYSASAAAPHRAWLDGLVLISTILFGLLLGYFFVDILPGAADESGAPARPRLLSLRSLPNPLALLSPAPRSLPVEQIGATAEAQGVVAQVVEPRRTRSEAGRQAGTGQEFLTVTAVIDNQGRRPLTYSLQDWQIRDSKGKVRAAEQVRSAGWLSGGTIAPGQHVLAQVSFLISEGEASPEIVFGPRDLHAVMRWDASPPPVQALG
jgi:hypothetical protein